MAHLFCSVSAAYIIETMGRIQHDHSNAISFPGVGAVQMTLGLDAFGGMVRFKLPAFIIMLHADALLLLALVPLAVLIVVDLTSWCSIAGL